MIRLAGLFQIMLVVAVLLSVWIGQRPNLMPARARRPAPPRRRSVRKAPQRAFPAYEASRNV